MRHASLFSGIGGFELAATWMGWENVLNCEIDPFPRKILNYYWPSAIQYEDIKTTDFTIHRGGIDILTGGFPCQPYSTAGKRLGKEDERHLWPEMLRAIREIQPRWVVGENVRGLTNWNGGMVFDEVQADLETEGYEVTPFLLPACAVDAPHRRDRIWFVAYAKGPRGATYADERKKYKPHNGQEVWSIVDPIGEGWITPDANGSRFQINPQRKQPSVSQQKKPSARCSVSGTFATRNGWKIFPTQSPVRSGNDGFSDRLDGITFPKWRNQSIKAYGNAVVPQVVFQIFKAIELFEKMQY